MLPYNERYTISLSKFNLVAVSGSKIDDTLLNRQSVCNLWNAGSRDCTLWERTESGLDCSILKHTGFSSIRLIKNKLSNGWTPIISRQNFKLIIKGTKRKVRFFVYLDWVIYFKKHYLTGRIKIVFTREQDKYLTSMRKSRGVKLTWLLCECWCSFKGYFMCCIILWFYSI